MAREQGQRSRLIFGAVSADVSLLKASGKPTEAKHDTRRVVVETPSSEKATTYPDLPSDGNAEAFADDVLAFAENSANGGMSVTMKALDDDDPMGAPSPFPPDSSMRMPTGDMFPDDPPDPRPFADQVKFENRQRLADAPPAPETEVRQGVWIGEAWIDLTERLAEIDERTRLDGMEVVATVALAHLPRMQVRDALWIAAAGKGAGKVLRLVFEGLTARRRGAVVRYTKRTNQALGVVIPRTVDGKPALALVELEWQANMRPPSARVTGPLAECEVSARETKAATALVAAFETPAGVVRSLRDERSAKRVELLTAAREGRLTDYAPPPERLEVEVGDDLAEAMLASAARA